VPTPEPLGAAVLTIACCRNMRCEGSGDDTTTIDSMCLPGNLWRELRQSGGQNDWCDRKHFWKTLGVFGRIAGWTRFYVWHVWHHCSAPDRWVNQAHASDENVSARPAPFVSNHTPRVGPKPINEWACSSDRRPDPKTAGHSAGENVLERSGFDNRSGCDFRDGLEAPSVRGRSHPWGLTPPRSMPAACFKKWIRIPVGFLRMAPLTHRGRSFVQAHSCSVCGKPRPGLQQSATI